MSVRYADACGDTGGSPDGAEMDMLPADYHGRVVVDGFFSQGSISEKGRNHCDRKEQVWEAGDASVGMRAATESKRQACVRRSVSPEIRYHGTARSLPLRRTGHPLSMNGQTEKYDVLRYS